MGFTLLFRLPPFSTIELPCSYVMVWELSISAVTLQLEPLGVLEPSLVMSSVLIKTSFQPLDVNEKVLFTDNRMSSCL